MISSFGFRINLFRCAQPKEYLSVCKEVKDRQAVKTFDKEI